MINKLTPIVSRAYFGIAVLVLLQSASSAQTVEVRNGSVIFRGSNESWKILSSGHNDFDPVVSPDASLVAFMREDDGPVEEGIPPNNSLWVIDLNDGKERQILDPTKLDVRGLHQPTFSLNGGYIYVIGGEGATTSAILQVKIRTGEVKAVTNGNSLSVIRRGKWAGYLLVRKHKYFEGGGSRDPIAVVKPSGEEMFELPNTDDPATSNADEWLKENDTTAW